MPAKKFVVPGRIQKSVDKLPGHIRKRIPDIFQNIAQNPILGKRLHGELTGYYKMSVGDYRIVYRFDIKNSTVVLVRIEHRQGVYK